MKRRMKWLMLAGCGGVVLQIASCGPVIADLLLQQVFVTVLRAVISGLAGSTDATQ